MPVWHAKTREWVKEGRLAVLGVTQEQHPERCRLFAQWQGFEWPILHDPINLLGNEAVPIVVALDEFGIVRAINPRPDTFERVFLEATFEDDAPPVKGVGWTVSSDRDALRKRAETESRSVARAWRAFGDASILWGDSVTDAVDAYERAAAVGDDPATLFRLGVAYRMRHESPSREAGDFERAVDGWTRALAKRPNQYIWRRRIQQYGPRLRVKPYPFYDWVEGAIAAVEARGQTPVVLDVMPYGAELAGPSRAFVTEAASAVQQNPDPRGEIRRDDAERFGVEVTLVPPRAKPGAAVRVHITLTPQGGAHWNNEAQPLRLWIDPPEGWEVSQPLLEAENGEGAESQEVRRLDFELLTPKEASGPGAFEAYALFNTCDEAGGVCLYLRRDIAFEVPLE